MAYLFRGVDAGRYAVRTLQGNSQAGYAWRTLSYWYWANGGCSDSAKLDNVKSSYEWVKR
jgi:hypothetical protein